MKQTIDFDRVVDQEGLDLAKYTMLDELFGTHDLLSLWVADMDFESAPEIRDALAARTARPCYGYTFPTDEYWQSIIDWQREQRGWTIQREHLTFVPGVVAGISLAINALSQPGDKVVIQPPVYHPFADVTLNNGRVVLENPLVEHPGGHFTMNLDQLEQIYATEQPRLLILCNPHNPIGLLWDEATLREVARLSRRYGVTVISDEIHGDLGLWGHQSVPYLTVGPDAEATGVAIAAPSKTFNIPGLVSSWAVAVDDGLRERFFGYLERLGINHPSFYPTIATTTAYRRCGYWVEAMLRYVEGNIRFVEEYCREHLPSIVPIRPEASFLLWLDCRKLGLEQARLMHLFVRQARVGVSDGATYGTQGTGFVRLLVATPRPVLAEALRRITEAVANR